MSSTASSLLTLETPCHMAPSLLSEAFVGRGREIEWLRDQLQPEKEHAAPWHFPPFQAQLRFA